MKTGNQLSVNLYLAPGPNPFSYLVFTTLNPIPVPIQKNQDFGLSPVPVPLIEIWLPHLLGCLITQSFYLHHHI
jgi:hypothetical protein